MFYHSSDLNQIFDSVFGGNPKSYYKSSIITKNNSDENYEINYTKDGAYLLMEVPGFNKSNLKVEMENGFIFVEGTRNYKLNGEEVTRSVSKKFQVGEGYNADSCEATIEDGLLTVYVPNMKKKEKKRISIL